VFKEIHVNWKICVKDSQLENININNTSVLKISTSLIKFAVTCVNKKYL